ncbi:DMT family transporter [Sphingomonas paeninsulae]|uniref:DMT family transporter n=1 Tax=Sphingomonas paeninsulae TaxID=2319844 RepID=A0A494TJQ8_SPHPE|nr:DMT family transporter [Sphingomonas paeninsulae]AYJ87253.1 DMT family transporter [Sphingomonas paeninsulae]
MNRNGTSVLRADRPLAGIGMRLATTVFLSIMFALAKLAQERGVNLIEILFFRQSIMIVPVVIIAAIGPGMASLKTKRPGAHFRRASSGLFGMALNFATVALLPLAEAQTVWFTTPLFATILGALWLREYIGLHRWGAVALGFVGVLIVVHPQSGGVHPFGTAIGLAAAFMVAVTSILIRQIGRTESPLTVVFWFGVNSSLALLLIMPWALHYHDAGTWLLLIGMGVAGSFGQIALTFSLRFAPVSVIAPVDYASLFWTTALGAALFSEWPTPWMWLGAPIIISSGLYIVWREHKLHRIALAAASLAE